MNKKVNFSVIKELLNYREFFFCSLLFSYIFYSFFINQNLTNTYDGLWSPVAYTAGEWELSIGRWMLPYIDRLHLSMHLEPLISIFTLAAILLAVVLIVDIFKVRGLISYLITIYMMTGTVVTCILSYRFTALSYGLSIFFSVAAVWLIIKVDLGKLRLFLSLIFLTFSLAAYQANMAVTAILIVFIFIRMLMERRDNKDIIGFIATSAVVFVLACIIYRIIAVFHMEILHIDAAAYNGSNDLSIIGMIVALPQSIADCYNYFWKYFFTDGFIYYNIFQRFGIFKYAFVGIMALIIIAVIGRFFKEKRYGSALLSIAAITVIPIAGCLSLLFATKAGIMIQMTFSLSIIFPCVLCLIDWECIKKKRILLSGGMILLVIFFTYGNAWQSTRDIDIMYEGRIATEAMVDRAIDELINKDLLSADKEYAFIGIPEDNDTFYVTTNLIERANPYACFGRFLTSADCIRMSYEAVLRDISVNIPIVEDALYEEIRELPEVKSMPQFPAEGSILEKDDVIIIKIS